MDEFDPDDWLDSLSGLGWEPGLDRILELTGRLGRPQDGFRAIHVVGTNGKTSVTRLIDAMLRGAGIHSGCLVSPHQGSWAERVLVEGRPVAAAAYLAAARRVRDQVRAIERERPELGRITQFESSVAIEFQVLADLGVEAGVVEAGLGGRLDATNVIESEVTVLTSIGLDHTEWLGRTEVEIATEKLAVLTPGTVLVTGPLPPGVLRLAESAAQERNCRLVVAGADRDPDDFRDLNRLVAAEAVRAFGEARPVEELLGIVAGVEIPGRLEWLRSGSRNEVPVLLDAAHNPPGAAALARAIPELARGKPVVLLFACMNDKDAEGILAELAPVVESAVMTAIPETRIRSAPAGRSTLDPAVLVGLAGVVGIGAIAASDPRDALDQARSEARRTGGIVVATGSTVVPALVQG